MAYCVPAYAGMTKYTLWITYFFKNQPTNNNNNEMIKIFQILKTYLRYAFLYLKPHLCIVKNNSIKAAAFVFRVVKSKFTWIILLSLITLNVLIVLYSFDHSKNLWRDYNSGKDVIAIYGNYRNGELLLYKNMLKAMDNLGIPYYGLIVNESSIFDLLRYPDNIAAYIMTKIFNPIMNFVTTHFISLDLVGYNVLYVNVPSDSLVENLVHLRSYYNLRGYDLYADIATITFGTNEILEYAFKHQDNKDGLKRDYKFFPAYFSHHYVPFNAPQQFDKAVITGTLWGGWRSSNRFKYALKKLANDNLLMACGGYGYKFLNKQYVGYYLGDNVSDKINNLVHKHGISLIVHSLEHIHGSIPTSRIAESIAAGSIVISDMHPFIMRHFKDSVLYFNHDASSDEIYIQIKKHIEWIKANPTLAKIKAKQAYDIWKENFTMEAQIQKLIQYVKDNKRAIYLKP